ncbi:MAG: hypothetical protein ACI3X6_01585, partial [Alloprevotella sp.]
KIVRQKQSRALSPNAIFTVCTDSTDFFAQSVKTVCLTVFIVSNTIIPFSLIFFPVCAERKNITETIKNISVTF